MRNRLRTACLALSSGLVALSCAQAQDARSKDLRLRATVAGQTLVARDPALSLTAAEGFRYAGGQRFILLGVADAEQHLFVDADSTRAVRRMVWVQLESFLPGEKGTYDYSGDSLALLGDVEVRVNVARWTGGPRAGSDRERLLALLTAKGYRVPEGMTRVRMVRVLDPEARSEVMVIYAETPAPGKPGTAPERALASIALVLGSQQR